MTEVPQVGQNCDSFEVVRREVNGGTHLVHERALAKLVALESAVFVTLHDFEVVFRGKGPKISILQRAVEVPMWIETSCR
jgi:hypothetical protein